MMHFPLYKNGNDIAYPCYGHQLKDRYVDSTELFNKLYGCTLSSKYILTKLTCTIFIFKKKITINGRLFNLNVNMLDQSNGTLLPKITI